MRLTRRQIAMAAIDVIERDGLDALSMSAVATEAGCGLVALYHHVPSRLALSRLVAAELLASLAPAAPPGCPPDQIRTLALAIRALAHQRPRAVLALAAGGPGHEPGLTAAARARLEAAGCGRAAANRIAGVLCAYVIGAHLLARSQPAAAAGRPAGPAAGTDPAADFDRGLELLVPVLAVLFERDRLDAAASV
jgi:AcrR family transcriptional regulator